MELGDSVSFVKSKWSKVVVVGAVLLSGFAVAIQATAASGNEAPVTASSIAVWSPAGIQPYNCSDVNWTGLEDYDLYHWIVSPQNYTIGSGPTQKKGSYEANFNKGGIKNGSVLVTYDDDKSELLPYKTFGYSSIQSNHLYTAVPAGKKVVSAKLNYLVDVKTTKGSAPVDIPTTLSSNHNLSHTCATPYSDPVIDILTVTSTYEETFTKSYSWELSKTWNLADGETADEKWFSKGEAPQFLITGTRSGPNVDDSSYTLVDDSVVVSGTFSLENATIADASITFAGDEGNGLGSVDCSTSATDVVDVYAYSCVLSPSTVDDTTPGNILKNLGFTVSGSVTDGNSEDVSNSFGDAAKQTLSDTLGGTADVEDDLAALGGSNCTNCTIDEQETEDPTDDVLSLKGASNSFTLSYSSNWDWQTYEPEDNCTQEFTNTASLIWSEGSLTKPFKWRTKCPPPTVELDDDVTSSYELSYDNNFSWSIKKELLEVDEDTLNAKYKVTATKTGPEVVNVSGTDVVVTGSFTTTYAANGNVDVTLTFTDRDGQDSTVGCDETDDTYECTIDSDKLPSLGSSDTESGWDGFEFVINAEVTTAGGSDEATRNGELGEPDEVNPIDNNKEATVTDDLGGYAATSIECDAGGESCWSGETDVQAGVDLQTQTAEENIVLTYELKWIGSVALDAESCPTIENTASVNSGGVDLDTATSSDEMACPELVITLSANDPEYKQTWDTEYSWSIEKKYLGADANTWQPKYSVKATRSSGTESNVEIVDESQKVTGKLVLALKPAVSIISDPEAVAAAMDLDTDTTECVISDGGGEGVFTFECTVETESVINAKDGLKDVSYQLDWSGAAYGEKVTGSSDSKLWGVGKDEPGNDVNKTAVIVDTNKAGLEPISITGGTKTGSNEVSSGAISSSPYTMYYTLNWKWNNGAGCGMSVENTAQLKGDEDKVLTSQQLATTVNCPKAEPGLTIGYYGNKAGGTEVSSPTYKPKWREAVSGSVNGWGINWNNTLTSLPNFANDKNVRDYMTLANCNSSGPNANGKTCQTMFRAQALASTMNAIKNKKFGEQSVLFRGSCAKVTDLLRDALHFTTVDSMTDTAGINTRIAYKTIFDDLNNSRAIRCPGSN